MEEPSTHAEGTPAEGQRTTGDTLPEIASLTEMVRVMIQDRERREKDIAEERIRRHQEREGGAHSPRPGERGGTQTPAGRERTPHRRDAPTDGKAAGHVHRTISHYNPRPKSQLRGADKVDQDDRRG